jgi:hypothetical protein
MMTFAIWWKEYLFFLGGVWMKKLFGADCIKIGSKIFMFAQEFNLLYSVDEETGEISFVSKMPGEPMDLRRLSSRFLRYKNTIILLPRNANGICIYDLDKCTWKRIGIEDRNTGFVHRFICGTIYENELILVGCRYPAIVVVNLNTYEVEYIDAVYDKFRENIKEINDYYTGTSMAVVDNKLYAASCLSNQVLIFDLKTHEWSWQKVGKEGNRYAGIAWDGKNFWLALRVKSGFVKWNFASTEEYLFGENDKIDNNDDNIFQGAIYDGKNVIFTGMGSRKTYVVNPDLPDVMDDIKIIDKSYLFWKKIDEVNFAMTSEGVLEIRDRENLEVVKRSYDLELDDERIMAHVAEHILDESHMIYENQYVTAAAFIKAL